MPDIVVKTATAQDLATVTHTIAAAFEDDPAWAAVLPPSRRRDRLYQLMRPFMAEGIKTGDVTMTSNHAAVALWHQPDRWKTPARVILRTALPAIGAVGARLPRMLRLLVGLEGDHPSTPAHWYLGAIGTLPAERSRGYGSVLLRHSLATFDARGFPAYLESSNPRNVPFYQRHGFRLVRELSYPGIPTLRAMWREPLTPREGR